MPDAVATATPEGTPDPTPDSATPEAGAAGLRIAELAAQLDEAKRSLDAAERRHAVDIALVRASTIDLETSRLLAERLLAADPALSTEGVVEGLRAAKPHLFVRMPPGGSATAPGRPRPSLRTGVMGASPVADAPPEVRAIADEARATGDRGALMRYLRARRTA